MATVTQFKGGFEVAQLVEVINQLSKIWSWGYLKSTPMLTDEKEAILLLNF